MRLSIPTQRFRFAEGGVALMLALVAAVGLSACSDSADVPTFPSPAVPTLDPSGADVELVTTTSVTGTYRADLPPTWRQKGVGETAEETFQDWEGERLRAEVAFSCELAIFRDGRPWGPTDFANRDMAFLDRAPGSEVLGTTSLVVDGEPATQMVYTTSFGGITIRHIAVFLVKDDCAWILRLRVFAPGDASGYVSLFGRIVDSFQIL